MSRSTKGARKNPGRALAIVDPIRVNAPVPEYVTLFGRPYAVANPYESEWTDTAIAFQFGAYGGINVVAFGHWEDALEEAAGYLKDTGVDMFVDPDYHSIAAELGIDPDTSNMDEVWEAAEADLIYTESGYIPSWEVHGQEVYGDELRRLKVQVDNMLRQMADAEDNPPKPRKKMTKAEKERPQWWYDHPDAQRKLVAGVLAGAANDEGRHNPPRPSHLTPSEATELLGYIDHVERRGGDWVSALQSAWLRGGPYYGFSVHGIRNKYRPSLTLRLTREQIEETAMGAPEDNPPKQRKKMTKAEKERRRKAYNAKRRIKGVPSKASQGASWMSRCRSRPPYRRTVQDKYCSVGGKRLAEYREDRRRGGRQGSLPLGNPPVGAALLGAAGGYLMGTSGEPSESQIREALATGEGQAAILNAASELGAVYGPSSIAWSAQDLVDATGVPLAQLSEMTRDEIEDLVDGVDLDAGRENPCGRPYRPGEARENFRENPPKLLPLAPADRKWDADAARKRLARWAKKGRKSIDWKKYRRAFLYTDPRREGVRAGYKLPVADVIKGRLYAVPHAIEAIAGVLDGARGGMRLPPEARKRIKRTIGAYYWKMGHAPPWERRNAPPSFREAGSPNDQPSRRIGEYLSQANPPKRDGKWHRATLGTASIYELSPGEGKGISRVVPYKPRKYKAAAGLAGSYEKQRGSKVPKGTKWLLWSLIPPASGRASYGEVESAISAHKTLAAAKKAGAKAVKR